jgi:hypothetical protein
MKLCFDHCYNFLLVDVSIKQVIIIKKKLSKNTRILDRADSDRKLQIKELLHIDQKKPTLNIQLNSQSEFRINVNIIGTKK